MVELRRGTVVRQQLIRMSVVLGLAVGAGAVVMSNAQAAPPSGLDHTLGMYVGYGKAERFRAAERALGAPVRWSVVFADQDSPSAMRSSVWGQFAGPKAYLPSVADRMNVTVTVPLAFGDANAKTPAGKNAVRANLVATAAGKWDEDYRQIARTMIGAGYGDAIIRLGNEPDGDFNPWSAVDNEDFYIDAYRHVHDVIASESRSFRFEYTTTRGAFPSYGRTAYPGDDYVDILGLDIYYRIDTPLDDRVWTRQYESVLRGHQQFAADRGKPVSYTEWGVAKYDQPEFIERMHTWFSSLPTAGPGRLLYQSYFNSDSRGHSLDQYPRSERAYYDLFGGGGGDLPGSPSQIPKGSVTSPPPVTAPSTTAPSTTAPSTTAPSTTAPSTTAPLTTAPLTTEPPTTEPPTTKVDGQWTLIDQEVTHRPTAYAVLDMATPGNWTTPDRLLSGSTFLRLDIVDKPTDMPVQVLVCMWQRGFVRETCNAAGVFEDEGEHFIKMRSLTTWWRKGAWNWEEPIDHVRILVKDPASGSLLSTSKCGSACYTGAGDAATHAPITFDVEMIVVGADRKLVPPPAWGGCPSAFALWCSAVDTPSAPSTTAPTAPSTTVGPPQGNAPVTVAIAAGAPKRPGRSLPFKLTLSHPASDDVVVHVQTQDKTAVAGVDYRPRDIRLVIPAGETIAWVGVPTLRNRADVGPATVRMVIRSSSVATVSTDTAENTILR